MGPELPATLFREGIYLIGTVGAPLFLGVFLIGLVMGILQSATQINDPAVGALPRLLVTVGICVVLGGWMTHRMATYLSSAIERMAGRGY